MKNSNQLMSGVAEIPIPSSNPMINPMYSPNKHIKLSWAKQRQIARKKNKKTIK